MRLFARKQPPTMTPHYELRLYESIQADKIEWVWTLFWHDEEYQLGEMIAQDRASSREEAIERGTQARQLNDRRRAAHRETIVLSDE